MDDEQEPGNISEPTITLMANKTFVFEEVNPALIINQDKIFSSDLVQEDCFYYCHKF